MGAPNPPRCINRAKRWVCTDPAPVGNIPPAAAEANIHTTWEAEALAARLASTSLRHSRRGLMSPTAGRRDRPHNRPAQFMEQVRQGVRRRASWPCGVAFGFAVSARRNRVLAARLWCSVSPRDGLGLPEPMLRRATVSSSLPIFSDDTFIDNDLTPLATYHPVPCGQTPARRAKSLTIC